MYCMGGEGLKLLPFRLLRELICRREGHLESLAQRKAPPSCFKWQEVPLLVLYLDPNSAQEPARNAPEPQVGDAAVGQHARAYRDH